MDGLWPGNGIEIQPGLYNITLKNLWVLNFDNGIFVDNALNLSIVNINSTNNLVNGFYLSSTVNVTIFDSNASNNAHSGINLSNSNGTQIIDNLAFQNGIHGIFLNPSNNNLVSGNNASNNNEDGIELSSSSNNTLNNNNANNNIDDGIALSLSSNNNTLTNNTANNNNDDGIQLSGSSNNNKLINNTASNNIEDGIRLVSSSNNNTFNNNNASNNNNDGISLLNSNNNGLNSNTANNNDHGILLSSSSNNNTLTNNTANNNGEDGLWLSSSSNNTLNSNTANDNNDDGIRLSISSNNTLTNNTANNNAGGISLGSSSNNTFNNNTANNNGVGILLVSSSNNNTFNNNNASNNNNDGIRLLSSSNNTLTNSSASNNTKWDWFSDTNSMNNRVVNLTINPTISFTSLDVAIRSVTSPPADPLGLRNISQYVNATNNSDDSWLFLNISYTNTDAFHTAQNTLRMWKRNNTWTQVPAPNNVNTTAKIVYANITSFSIFAPLGLAAKVRNLDTGIGYTTIQAAIDDPATMNGHTLMVEPGIFNEGVNVHKSLTIMGSGPSMTTVVAASCGFYVSTDNTNISGFTVYNGTGPSDAGICYDGASFGNISNNVLFNNTDGIKLNGSSNFTLIDNNTAWNNTREGITLYSSSNNNTITNNNASNNKGVGIRLSGSSNNTLASNNANNNEDGIRLTVSSNNNTITGNNASNNDEEGIELFSSINNKLNDNTANNNGNDGIRLLDSDDNIMEGNTASMNGANGVFLDPSNNNTISNSNVSYNNESGIKIDTSNNNTVHNNTANFNGDYGILLILSNNTQLTNNTVNSNNNSGIFLSFSKENKLINNTANSNVNFGIFLSFSNYNNLTKNTVSQNIAGIFLDPSNNNRLTENNASQNNVGILILESSKNNTLTKNTANQNLGFGINIVNSSKNTLILNTVNKNRGIGIRLNLSIDNLFINNSAINNTRWDWFSDDNSLNNTVFNLTLNPLVVSFTSLDVALRSATAPAPDPGLLHYQNIGKYVNATNNSAASWLFLNISYTDADVEDVEEDSLRMWKHNGTWTQVPPPNGVNTAQNYVFANITSFSIFAPMGITPTTIRVYGSKDLTTRSIYDWYRQPFNPSIIPSDSITFNPALIEWDGINFTMSADSTNIDVKKHLRMWYEPAHEYKGGLGTFGPHPTIMLESIYTLLDRVDKNPTHGSAGSTIFALPLAEIPTQPGLGTFDADNNSKPDLVSLAKVEGTTPPYWKTTNGTMAVEKLFEVRINDTVRFLDHALMLESIDEEIGTGNPLCQVNITYIGNIDDDTTKPVLLNGSTKYLDRHNNDFPTPSHPDRTWYTRAVAVNRVNESDKRCKIVVGKELSQGDTFYVNGLRYDVPAIETIDTDGDGSADTFKYITLRTPVCKDLGSTPSIVDESVVGSQEIECTETKEYLPVNPPFNGIYDGTGNWTMIDDINIPEIGDDLAETPGEHTIHPDYDEVVERIIHDVPALKFIYLKEDREPRYHTNLLEILNETNRSGINLGPLTEWSFFHVQTEPSNYTEFILPKLPDVGGLLGDYLYTSSFIAPNSIGFWHEIKGFAGIKRFRKAPRVSFAFDRNNSFDPYINDNFINNATVRIYGEDSKGPIRVYTEYRQPFNPAVIPKDSVTFNPAIILWDGINFSMSADSTDADLKKFLRMWYEPGHIFRGELKSEGPHPTIVFESTYMLVDSALKNPLSGSANTTTLAFPLAKIPGQPGLGTFDANNDSKVDLVKLAKVEGNTPRYWKITNGTVSFETSFNLNQTNSTRFLDHEIRLESVDEGIDGKTYCQVTVTYIGNTEDDTATSILVGGSNVYLDRHNNQKESPIHPDATWYVRAVAVSPIFQKPVRCKIVVGKELTAGDTFYVNGLRYDVAAVEVIDTDGDSLADEFGYITIRTPICKDTDGSTNRIRDNSVVTTQWITCVPRDETLPLNPPFNIAHKIVDDIDIPENGSHGINSSFEAVGDRIIDNEALEIVWIGEDKEPRYHTNLQEILAEKFRGARNLPPLEGWDWFHVQTIPDQYTEFILPPDTLNSLSDPLHNDYLITTSWYTLNSILYDHDIGGSAKLSGKAVPRVAFVHNGNSSTGIFIN
jgi:parallel beta-helix repeat protein